MKNFIADALLRKIEKLLQPRMANPHPGRMLWPAHYGTYRRAERGPLTDENGNPRYA